MKDHARRFTSLASVPVLTLTLIGSFAYFAPGNLLCAVAAQSTSLSGSYGFGAVGSQLESNGDVGAALLGVMNLDGAGNVTGTLTFKPRNLNEAQAQALSLPITGTYTANPDGTGTLTIVNSDLGVTLPATVVTTDGGQGFQFLGSDGVGTDFTLRGQAASLSGELPAGLFLTGAKGGVSLTVSGVRSTDGSITVYSAAAATGSGTGQCRDGSSGNWTASVPALTIVLNSSVTSPGDKSGNYFFGGTGALCGRGTFGTRSGLVTGTASATGAVSLVLHDASTSVISGIGRVMKGGSLNGSYAVQVNYEPLPAGTIGLMKFDGAGNVAASLTSAYSGSGGPATATLSGTYSLNPDGSGSINLKDASGQSGPAFAFVLTDGGAQLLLIRTDNNAGFDVAFGTARLQ